MTDITLRSGTSRNLDVTLIDNNTPAIAIDLTLVDNIIFLALDGERVIIQKDIDDGAITVTDASAGEFLIIIDPDDTSPAFGVGSTTTDTVYSHELRLIFTDGTQEVPASFDGAFTVTKTKSWDTDTLTASDDRVVYVQGRY